jgi:HD-GYP domain-containing protein (c-di-GMP phosphodiesterase class II)
MPQMRVNPEANQRIATPAALRSSTRLIHIFDDLREVLFDPIGTRRLPQRVDTIAADLASFVEKDADHALFEVHRHGRDQFALYSVLNAVRCAIACELIKRKLGWSETDAASLVKAALTKNVAITRLQGTLALRATTGNKPTAEEAHAIAAHPSLGAEILRSVGVDDAGWLQAVAQHHERVDGRGYPTGMREPSHLATVLRCVDDFFAKISARASRPALALRRAVRELYAAADGRPIVEALIKEFGFYPPGTFVRLANGDLGIVLRRGERIDTPLAVALANCNGEKLGRRVHRDTRDPRYAIVIASNGGDGCRL